MPTRYPNIKVRLVGTDGNAFALMAKVRRALQFAKVPQEEIDEFLAQAKASDYDHLLRTIHAWVDIH